MKSTARESSRTRSVRSLPTEKTALTLKLEVTDPEVVGELRKRADGEERQAVALAALRIGMLALRSAGGSLDANVIHEAGMKLIADLGTAMAEKGSVEVQQLTEALQRQFDPATGAVAQKLDLLLEKGGELSLRLGEQLGAESTRINALLQQHLGEQSVLAGLLSREDAQGLRTHVQAVVDSALVAQRAEILREFSLDSPQTALSRLLEKLSGDAEGSVMSRLAKLIDGTRERVDQSLSLDDERSSLGRLKRELHSALEGLEQRNAQFQREAREFFGTQTAAREGARAVKGRFEDLLSALAGSEAQKAGDLFDRLSTRGGWERFVTQMGPESANPGTRILWLAVNEPGNPLARALAELEEARTQDGAPGGVLIFSRQVAPAELAPFARFGPDVVAIWDPADPETDVYVRAAFSVARALVVRTGKRTEGVGKAMAVIDDATRSIVRQLAHLAEVKKWAETMAGQSAKIVEKSHAARVELEGDLRALDQQLLSLKALQRAG